MEEKNEKMETQGSLSIPGDVNKRPSSMSSDSKHVLTSGDGMHPQRHIRIADHASSAGGSVYSMQKDYIDNKVGHNAGSNKHDQDDERQPWESPDVFLPDVSKGSWRGSHGSHFKSIEEKKNPIKEDDEDEDDDFDPKPLGAVTGAVKNSNGTAMSSGSTMAGRELTESVMIKLYEMRMCFAALFINIVLIVMFYILKMGLEVGFSVDMSHRLSALCIELIMLFASVITQTALDDGASAYFGYQLASRRGYSLAVCGFLQGNLFVKLGFPGRLSLNSPCRKILSRASMIWGALNVLLWISPVVATATKSKILRKDYGVARCIFYTETGSPVDRGVPTLASASGTTEFLFGTAIGIIRVEDPSLKLSTAIITPQVTYKMGDSDSIIGLGYTLDISTKCICSNSTEVAGMVATGLDTTTATQLKTQLSALGQKFGMATVLTQGNDTFKAIATFTNTAVCGGIDMSNGSIPICTTTFSNYRQAKVQVGYNAHYEGLTNSVESTKVIRSTANSKINIWPYAALRNILGGESTANILPSSTPSIINPLMWWTTTNLLVVDKALIQPGVEAMYAAILRAGVQRTYATAGSTCAKNIQDESHSVVSMESHGYVIALIVVITQIVACFIAIAGFVPWLQSENPIGPAVRLTKDSVFFSMMVYCSNMISAAESMNNVPEHVIWEALDVVARVGESVSSRDDALFGHITLDKPKMVASFQSGRRYT